MPGNKEATAPVYPVLPTMSYNHSGPHFRRKDRDLMVATAPPPRDRVRHRCWVRRAGLPITALIAISITLAACGRGSASPGVASVGSTTSTTTATGSTGGSGSSAYEDALADAKCMRAHGVANFPDPQSDGGFIISGSGSSNPSHSPEFHSATQACEHLLQNGGQPSAGQAGPSAQAADLKYAKCMRAHGVLNFPDPGPGVRWNLGGNESIDHNTPQFQTAMKVCLKIAPPQA